MSISNAQIQATVKAAPAAAPGFATIAADWLDLINTVMSITFLTISAFFLLWRWWVAYRKEKKDT